VLGELPEVDEVQNRVNRRFDSICHYHKVGIRHVLVCSFCDEFLMCKENTSFLPIDWISYLKSIEIDEIIGLTER
jgi:hypothetical protein